MRVENSSSFNSLGILAAIAASCFASTAYPGIGEVRPLHRTGEQRPLTNDNWSTTSRRERTNTGGLFVYVEEEKVTSKELPSDLRATRATSEQEHLIAEIRSWANLSENWDGDGASAPISDSLHAASDFVCLLAREAAMPEPMLHASGRAGLVWDDGEHYAELEFFPDRRIVYYVTGEKGKHKGFDEFDRQTIPASIQPLVPT
jgi:hypothetical protein